MSEKYSSYTNYASLRDMTLQHLPWELYQRWLSYGNKIAIVSASGEPLSYDQLALDVEKKYQALKSYELQKSDVVVLGGIVGADLIATLVACWLGGATVALLDNGLPEARQRKLLEVSAPRLIVHDNDISSLFPDAQYCRYTDLKGSPAPIRDPSDEDTAYIVFTSGSMGEPKAILGSHRGLSHFIHWQSEAFNVGEGDRFAQLTASGFDVIYRSVLTPLYSGAQLWIPPYGVHEGEAIVNWLRRTQISAVHLVPSILKTWLALCPNAALPDLRWIFSAGEMLYGKILDAVYQQWAFAGQVVNLYGPSETTLAKCFYRCTREDAERSAIPVGQPLPNTEIWVMDGPRRCEASEAGEIVIRTPYRAKGYLGNEHVAFRQTPGAHDADDQLYYTGDLGYVDNHGLLHLQGRKDDQIKINGVRVELGEIEAYLHSLPQVQEAAVCYHDGLIAYLVAPGLSKIVDINDKLNQNFPVAMRPRLILCTSLPRNANGKVDRQMLSRIADENQGSQPRNDAERQLHSLCMDIVGRKSMGMDEDLRYAGMQSLQQMLFISRTQQLFRVTLTMNDLYQHPTLSALAKCIAQRRPASLEVIVPGLKGQTRFPVSKAQARLYALDNIERCGNAYNMTSAYSLHGLVDRNRFKDALADTFEHYAVLRTVFCLEDGALQQRILEKPPLPFREKAVAADELTAALDQLNAPFDLQQGPLVRFALFDVPASDTLVFAYTIHHSLFDGPSHALFLQTLLQYYAGQERPLLPVLHYHDYACHEQRQGAAKAENIDYWRRTLTRHPPLLTLPTDHPRPTEKRYQGNTLAAAIPVSGCIALGQRLAGSGITRFQYLLAAFGLLLGRYATQQQVLLGVPVNGRTHPMLKNLPGMFAESLPLLIDVGGPQSIDDYLAQVQQSMLSGMEHQCPLEEIIQALELPRDSSHSPLFDVMFTLAEPAVHDATESGLQFEPCDYHSKTAKYDLLMEIKDSGSQVSVHIEYDSDLFEQQTVKALLQNYMTLLDDMLEADGNTLLSRLNCVNAHERRQLLDVLGHTPYPIPRNQYFIDYFRQQCATTPDAIAVVGEDRQLTYSELNQASGRLAHRLRQAGVDKHTVVSIVSERSSELVVAILAVLKLNAVYVPVDPSTPDSRINYMLSDSATEVVLASEIFHSRLTTVVPEQRILTIDSNEDGTLLDFYGAVEGGDPCVIFYTSGSTGVPKGVTHTHLGLINFALYENDQNKLESDDRVAFYANQSFDVSMWSLLLPLLCGAAVHVLHEKYRYSLDMISGYFERHGITVALLPTQLCEAFMKEPVPQCLRLLWTAGEKLQQVPVNPGYRLINGYGPTEYTGCTTRYDVFGPAGNIPIGRPLGNTWVYILDENLNLQPLGAPGELCIAGLQMTSGYLNQPEQTSLRYVANPYITGPENALLYRTGDIARWQADGNLIYLGRRDDQVKIRGFRVELQEVEQALLSLPAIKQATVLGQSDENGRYKLVAYIVTQMAQTVPEIEEALRQSLPDYMLPSHYLSLPELPITANGKVDKDALRALPLRRSKEGFVSPATATEKLMVDLWQKHLAVAKVGRNDDFFDLGGNSITAIMFGAELNRRTSKQVPLKGLFQFSRLAAFSEYVDELEDEGLKIEEVSIHPDADNVHQPFGLTDVQCAYLIGRESVFELGNVATHVYREDRFSRMDIERLAWCLNQLVQRHTALRTVYSLEDRSQRVLANVSSLQIAVQDLRDLSPECQNAALLCWRKELEQQTFDASDFPLFEFRASQFDDHFVLHFSFDALIMDALSMRIFMRELGQLYRHPLMELPSLGITFRDYQLAYEQLKTTDRYLRDQQYWQDRLPELPQGPELAMACRPDLVSTPNFVRQGFSLEKEVWQALQLRIRQAKISPTVPFLALYGKVLSRWSANEHFLINLTLFQREDLHPETHSLLGDFTVLSLFEYYQREEAVRPWLNDIQSVLWDDLSHTLFSGLEVQSALARQNQVSGDKPIAPVVLTSLLGIPLNDESYLSDDYLGRDYAQTQTSQVWLDNKIYERNGELVVEWDYVSQLFDEQQIRDMLDAYRQALISLSSSNWDEPLHIPLPASDELLICQYNATDCVPCTPQSTVHQQFLRTAEQFPATPAVITSAASFSYGEIAAQATKLASHLQAHAVRGLERVMICAEKGASLVSGTLGIMMAGAVFVPVNIQWPIARLRDIASQAGIRHVMTTRQQMQRLHQAGGISEETIYHLMDGGELLSHDNIPAAVKTDLNAPAYVIFTSGSTGKPKGVCISHFSVMNTLQDINQRLSLTDADRTLCLSNISFDLAVYDIFGPLIAGAAVVMPEEDALDQPDTLLQLMHNRTVTIYNSAPAIMALLVSAAVGQQYHSVRHVLLSGDFIPLDLPARIKQVFPAAALLSLGGATEGSIWSIAYPVDNVAPNWTSIPYGKPLCNQQVWVLDRNLQPCPVGVPGEIYLAGFGVAQGYEADPEKTAAHFGRMPDGQRYYRTGDQGIMHREGHVEILGRLDHQVKINGFRIELGEIDSVLQEHPDVLSSLTRVVTHDNGQKSLAAYVIPRVFDHLAFKLAKHGIRNVTGAPVQPLQALTPEVVSKVAAVHAVTRKSYRHYQPEELTLEVLQPLLLTATMPAGHTVRLHPEQLWQELAILLTPLRAFEHQTEGLCKYRYPSAGGLYSVRTYLVISRAWGEFQGQYYYHPENHTLVQLTVDPNLLPEAGIYLQLNAYLPAIEPEYHQLAQRYSHLEAGCMEALLAQHIDLHKEETSLFSVDDDNELAIMSYRLAERETDDVPVELPQDTLLLLRTTACWEAYCLRNSRFSHCGDIPLSFDFGQDEHNDAIISHSAALLLLPEISDLKQGHLVQDLTESLLKATLGSCVLGQLQLENQLMSYTAQRTFFGALAIGRVTDDAMANGEVELIDHAAFPARDDALRAHLEHRLPEYMVPQDIFFLPTLPLTPNGKVDIKSLPQSQGHEDLDNACQPRDQYEERLLELWNDVLPQANVNNIHTDFFSCGGNSLDAILLSIKMSQRFVRKIPTALVYKHRTIAQQANAIIECVLKPTEDFIVLNQPDSPKPKRVILFPTSDSGAEAYHQLAQALAADIEVIGVSHFLINYPEKVTSDWSVALDFYCQQVENIVSFAPEQPVWLGGWSMGGNIAIAVAERLAKSCPQIRHKLIIFDSLPAYNTVEREVRENTTDEWSSYHPDNIMYRQFMMAGYSRRHYFHFVDCQFDHLNAMQVAQSSQSILLIKCMVPIGYFYSDIPDNGWGAIAKSVTVHRVDAHHINLLIDNDMIRQVADIIRQTLKQDGGNDGL